MKYDFRNCPKIEDKFHSKFIITEEDILDDYGDCVHVKHPVVNDEWRFYYKVDRGSKVLDTEGVIQL